MSMNPPTGLGAILRAVPPLLMVLPLTGPASDVPVARGCSVEERLSLELRAVAEGIIAADNARDLERVIDYYTVNAVLMPPGEAAVVGRDRIRPRYAELFARFDPEIETYVDEVCADGLLGYVRGRTDGRLVPRQDGEPRSIHDAYLMLLRREEDGAWRISHLVWHSAGPSASGGPVDGAG